MFRARTDLGQFLSGTYRDPSDICVALFTVLKSAKALSKGAARPGLAATLQRQKFCTIQTDDGNGEHRLNSDTNTSTLNIGTTVFVHSTH